MSIRPAMTRLQRQLVAALQAHMGGGKPRPPLAGVLIWEAFCGLSRARRYDHGLPLPLTEREAAGWVGLQGAAFGLDHIRLIMAMDKAWLDHVQAAANKPEAAAPITPGIFDTMFA